MLVLTRKVDEVVLIGEDIRVMVTRIDKDSVRLGVIAPAETVVLREELIDVEAVAPGRQQT